MFAQLLLLPFAAAAVVFLILAKTVDESYAIGFVPFIVIAALIFILAPQINWWWYSRRPPDLNADLQALLARFCGFYRRLTPLEQRRFRGRVAMFNMGTDWEPLAFPDEKLPTDVQLGIAAQAVTLTFYRQEFLFDKFEKVIVFPRPFPTPEHPYDHASELHQADGCLLFSAEQVMLAFAKPDQWYNVAMHEYARAFVLQNPHEAWPDFSATEVWEKMKGISGMSRQHIESVIGLAGVDALPVAVFHYFNYPDAFHAQFPEAGRQFSQIFSRPGNFPEI
ncbi:MAG: zinc-dependent peptidase [Saprospiraceae bacterium]|nr:zinc-dependent peptidase [Saprospiraceae bacterium]